MLGWSACCSAAAGWASSRSALGLILYSARAAAGAPAVPLAQKVRVLAHSLRCDFLLPPHADFVGMACGRFGMPFSTFVGGTLLGKGIIKASWQCALFTMCFSAQARTAFVDRAGSALEVVLPASVQVWRVTAQALCLAKLRRNALHRQSTGYSSSL
jgi:hypothetical protein